MHWSDYLKIFQHISIRYFMVAGIAFLFFYLLFSRFISYKKIQSKFPNSKDYIREIGYSFFTMALFAFVPFFIVKNPAVAVHTTLYKNISDHGWLYFFLAFPLMAIMHDTYFYWMHRLMHNKKLFKIFHVVHHQSTNPSPWAAYSFHPFEAVIEMGIYPIFLFTIPIHYLHFFIFFFFSIVYNVYGHLGYELYSKNFSSSKFGKWINTSVSHNQHHQYFKGNYGLYFTFWDRMMGTMREDYDQKFEEVTSRKNNVAAA